MRRNDPGEQDALDRVAAFFIEKREDKGMSPKQLADKAGLDPRTVKRVERGEGWSRGPTVWSMEWALDLQPGAALSCGVRWKPGPEPGRGGVWWVEKTEVDR